MSAAVLVDVAVRRICRWRHRRKKKKEGLNTSSAWVTPQSPSKQDAATELRRAGHSPTWSLACQSLWCGSARFPFRTRRTSLWFFCCEDGDGDGVCVCAVVEAVEAAGENVLCCCLCLCLCCCCCCCAWFGLLFLCFLFFVFCFEKGRARVGCYLEASLTAKKVWHRIEFLEPWSNADFHFERNGQSHWAGPVVN